MNSATSSMDLNSYKVEFVYNKYKTEISELIADIEVYEHDLPKSVMAQIAELFQATATYESLPTMEKKRKFWGSLVTITSNVTTDLYIHAICLFIKKIEEYEKIYHGYNYKGEIKEEEQEQFYIYAKKKKKEISKLFIEQLRKCYKGKIFTNLEEVDDDKLISYFAGVLTINLFPSFRRLKNKPEIPMKAYEESIDLRPVYELAGDLLKEYQTRYPKVIDSGRRQPVLSKIFWLSVSWIIPIFLAGVVLIKLFNESLWGTML